MAEYFPIDVNYKSYSGSFSGSFFGDGRGITGVNASAGGANNTIQFNDSGRLGGSGDFTFDQTIKSLTLTGSLNVSGSITSTSGFTGSLLGTASYATQALSASWAPGGGGASFPYTGSAIITGSLIVTGSTTSTLGFTGSLFGTASFAANGGVTQLLAGSNISLSPTTGVGQVTISSTAGGGGFNTATGSYGSFYDTTTQTNPVANVPRSMSFDSTDITNGVSISGSTNPFNTYVKTENAGVYNIQFSAQLDKTDSGTDEVIIWLRKNGIDLTDTATTITLIGNNGKQVAAWNWFVTSAANDYYQVIWIAADTNIRLLAEPISGTHPGIPSVILTANRVDQFLSNTGSFSGSFNGSFTGSLFGTSSWATNALTASYLNTLNQNLTFNGNLTLNGTASISTLVVNQTQYSSGSNQLGDAVNDTQTLYGTVRIPTGSLTVTGSVLVNGSSSISGPLTVSFGNIVGGTALYANGNTIHNIGRGIYTTGYAYGIQGNQTMVGNWGSQPDAAGVHGTGQIGVYGSGSIAGFSGPSAFFTTLTGATRQGARLVSSLVQVRGSGATSATTALLVENTNGSASLVVLDDRNATFYNGLTVNNNLTVTGSIRYAISGFGNYTLNNAWTDSVNNNSISLYDNNGNISIAASPSAFNRSIILRPTSVYGGAGVLIGPYVTGNGTIWPNILNVSGSSNFIGKVTITSSINTAISGSILTVIGSGSAQPIFTVRGSQGELFSVTDSLSGSLFSVNDISGLPILEVFSDNTTLIGDYLDPMLITTKKVTMTNSGSFVVYSLPTASYDTAFFDYSIKSGSNARAGQIMAIQSGTSVNFTETTTTDFGNTTAVSFTVLVSGSNMVLTGSAATGSWTIKSIIRGI